VAVALIAFLTSLAIFYGETSKFPEIFSRVPSFIDKSHTVPSVSMIPRTYFIHGAIITVDIVSAVPLIM
jgi:hypothetical protein